MSDEAKTKRSRKRLAYGAAAVTLLGFLVFLYNRPKGELPPLPVPNGYADFVKAGMLLDAFVATTDLPGGVLVLADPFSLEDEEKRELVEKNRKALELIDDGLRKEVGVIHDDSHNTSLRLVHWWRLLVVESEVRGSPAGMGGLLKALKLGNSIQNKGGSESVIAGYVIESQVNVEMRKRVMLWNTEELFQIRSGLLSIRDRRQDPDEAGEIYSILTEAESTDLRESISFAIKMRAVTTKGAGANLVREINSKAISACDATIAAIDARLETLEKSGALDL